MPEHDFDCDRATLIILFLQQTSERLRQGMQIQLSFDK